MWLWVSYKKTKELDPELDPYPEPDPLVRSMDPGIRIRTKMSRIPNTGLNNATLKLHWKLFGSSLSRWVTFGDVWNCAQKSTADNNQVQKTFEELDLWYVFSLEQMGKRRSETFKKILRKLPYSHILPSLLAILLASMSTFSCGLSGNARWKVSAHCGPEIRHT